VLLSCICGSDLWPYRRTGPRRGGPGRIGHEFPGVVEAVGSEVLTVRPGDVVVAPFVWSDGTCPNCRAGIQTSCLNGGDWGADRVDGGQGEAVRVPFADGTLVVAPVAPDDQRLPALLTLSDVMGTGHHAALSAGVGPGSQVVVVGDGAVGRSFGATDVLAERGDDAVARPGGTVGYVGVPAGLDGGLPHWDMFGRNIAVRGGVAPVRAYLPELMAEVLVGALDPSPVFDLSLPLDRAPEGYAAMDRRTAIKVLLRP